ncbi:MAG: sigma-54-dependent Fis family transcriptional regulator [Deltaproteobacteria bacterium]|jgi:two-component system response regulator AtoC|nr:sigma-54-dependent Fis family transcriptional regulator [Deltaproteobacteria bacterium]MBW2530089.1 sigma-54-dependent Fis family transcriptional regulator [Deltaproteobacteria bacterium]
MGNGVPNLCSLSQSPPKSTPPAPQRVTGAREALIVGGDEVSAAQLSAILERLGSSTSVAPSVRAALDRLSEHPVALALVEWSAPGVEGRTLLATLGRNFPELPVVVLARQPTVAAAVEAMRAGAADYLPHPVGAVALTESLARLDLGRVRAAPPGGVRSAREQRLIGTSDQLTSCLERIDRAARGTATVLLRGESGTGKELAAREIHRRSERAAGPFVKIHCAALPDTLLESELFGYERGAFSGAMARKLGRVDLARGGTLFLDEVGDVKPAIQVKLLSLLQDREYERLGGTETLRADVRFIAATHRDLESMVASGKLRQDLFYRLNVLPVWMPPLRARGRDVVLLARHFCAVLGAQNGKPDLCFDDQALALLMAQPWPGNVRQLQNVVERLVVLSDGVRVRRVEVEAELTGAPDQAPSVPSPPSDPRRLERHRRDAERQALIEALRAARYNRTRAARMLGVSRRTLYNRLRAHGLHAETSPRKPAR